ncbi:MAG: flippase, partial [Candidatus Margulisbacteria bacterium]|nr:flippase [Candidatus Margulisiibacteriota bacterium]
HNLQAGKNFIWITIGQIVTRILGLFFFIVLSFKLGSAGLGAYSFISSFVPLWFLLIDLGASHYLYREWVKRKETHQEIENDFHILLTSKLILSILIFIFFSTFNYIYNQNIFIPLVIFFISNIFAQILQLADVYLMSFNAFKYISFRQIIEKTIITLIGIISLFIFPSLKIIFIIYLLSQLIALFYYALAVLPFKFKIILNLKRSGYLFKKGLPFMFIILFASIYAKTDIIMLRYFDNFEVVGWYSTAYKFIDLVLIFPTLFVSAIFPVISSLYHTNKAKEKFTNFLYKCIRIIFSTGLIASLLLFFYSGLLVAIFFPPDFYPSIYALKILAISICLTFFNMLFNDVLILQNKEKTSLLITSSCATLNVILNFILIPRFSLYGAAWASVLCGIINFFLLQKHAKWKSNKFLIAKVTLILFLNICVVLIFKHFNILANLYISSFVVIINILLLSWYGLLKKEDIKLFYDPIKMKLTKSN